MLPVPPRKQAESFRDFVDLPVRDPHCESVDMIDGMWYICKLCKTKVPRRSGRAWTLSRWMDHIVKDGPHDLLKKNTDSASGIREKKKAGKVRCIKYVSL